MSGFGEMPDRMYIESELEKLKKEIKRLNERLDHHERPRHDTPLYDDEDIE